MASDIIKKLNSEQYLMMKTLKAIEGDKDIKNNRRGTDTNNRFFSKLN